MAEEATLFVLKPDVIQRRIVGAVLSRVDESGLRIIGVKLTRVSRVLAEEHYKHIRGKPFFEETVAYLQGKLHGIDHVLAFVLWGENAIERLRQLTGATNPEKADPSSIRGTFGRMKTDGLMENVVHASSDAVEARREISLWFHPQELLRDAASIPAARR